MADAALLEYFQASQSRSLLPMDTNEFVIEVYGTELRKHIYEDIKASEASSASFQNQTRINVPKTIRGTRRTVKLDPLAEYFYYHLVWENRSTFKASPVPTRKNFGYRFANGREISPKESFQDFKTALYEFTDRFTYHAKFDIATYFNSIYAHDLVNWFGQGRDETQKMILGKCLRQCNSGRSIDCLPQGISPTKILGSHFLAFVDNSVELRSEQMIRFMDDFYVFSADLQKVEDDYATIERLLGVRALNLNPSKTLVGSLRADLIREGVDEVKVQLLRERSRIATLSDKDPEDDDIEVYLTEEQEEYLLGLLRNPSIEEEDAELVLTLMRDYGQKLLEYVETFLHKFPSLMKSLYRFLESVEDKDELGDILLTFLQRNQKVPEFQLFWLAHVLQRYLLEGSFAGDLFEALLTHPSSTTLTRAKVLEIDEHRFSLDDRRETLLRNGKSDWEVWGAMVGLRRMEKASRNQLFKYAIPSGPMNQLVGRAVLSV